MVASVMSPVEAHVDGLGPLLIQGFVSKCISCGIVHLYSCWGLWVSHFYDSCASRYRFLCNYKWCPKFCLCYWRHEIFRDFAYIVNGYIVWGVLTVVAEILIASWSSVCLGHWQLWCVTVDLQSHIYLFVSDNFCWMTGGIIYKPNYIVVGLLCGIWLVWCKVDQGDQHCVIHYQGII